ncbi:hypothetical protein CSOJ01_04569 [Colletotrichum sojae]|uniref:F-box domain-containing protein n=1 Tax=Colletotrichum sojae TaxID=2175907 RepID=A0A8H6JIF9_9PEZI|nr:hypothetical protein CSOJ01_04569 [Colletotrichum sojae]
MQNSREAWLTSCAAQTVRRPGLLDLPTEIWDMILARLEPHDCFFLSKVHRLLQWLAGKDFAEWQRLLREASRSEKMTFLMGLARVRLDHWFCRRCESTHYAPGRHGKYIGLGGYLNRRKWDACLSAPSNMHRIFDKYAVYHSDIQLALKR